MKRISFIFLFLLSVAGLLLLGGCASIPTDIERSESRALQGTETTRLGKIAQPLLKAHPGESGFRPLRNGVDALLARIVLAEAAERSAAAWFGHSVIATT